MDAALSTSALRHAMATVSGQLSADMESSTTKKRIERRVPNPRSRIRRNPAKTARTAQTTIEDNDTD